MAEDVGTVVLALLLAYAGGYIGAWLFVGTGRALLFLLRVRGFGRRMCIGCRQVTPAVLHHHGRWTCLACNTPHPDPVRRQSWTR